MMREQDHQQQSSIRVFNELCSLILTILDTPSSSPSSSDIVSVPNSMSFSTRRTPPSKKQVSPAGFACLMLGVSLTLMLCGSVTFVIGFILMPWVVGFLLLFYLLGVLSTVSGLGRAILCPSSHKEMPAWNFS